jgi:hypothetical protein
VTINGAALAITANSASKVYGQTATFLGTAFTSTGLLNGDAVAGVTLTSTGAVATAAVGSYAITPSAAVGTGVGNYTITYTAGTLTVNPASLTITANNASKIYGQTATFLGTAFTSSRLLNADTISSVTLTSTGVVATAAVGSYAITPSAAVGMGLNNYIIAYTPGTLTVVKASTVDSITSNLPSPAIVGQIVTVSFAVAPQFAGTPTGSVMVTASTGQTCTGALSAGAGSCTLTFSTGGSRALTAIYLLGDTNFLPSPTSAAVTQVVSSVSLSTASLLFGNQLVGTNSARQAVSLSNVGIAPLGISNITIVGANPADYNFTSNCPIGGNLGVGRSCNINVRFSPTAAVVRTAAVSISDADATSPQTVSLTGTGVAPVNQVSPLSLPFGNVPIRTNSTAQVVTIANPGTAGLVINSINLNGANPGQFSQNNNCPPTLAAGASCTVNVTFNPTSRGAKTANVNVNVAAPALSQSVALTGTGQ